MRRGRRTVNKGKNKKEEDRDKQENNHAQCEKGERNK